ncbi:hypothetical protein [Spirosoma linguale]|uniref:DUF3592 domain-containing protein n=1 Tax=Spirosoma linguale (strain ATCC 33905 / DSM 74 / LMG 10896 / Claus 1) TaxID=504472 RepID=D2QCM8_SPILD|nr:hypothetical protein Slin_1988 [Spirosoma linguale DSM 74]
MVQINTLSLMFRQIVTALGRLYSFVASVVVALLLGVATWGMWHYYRDVYVQDEFLKKGVATTVLVTQAEPQQRSWQDLFSNSTYLTVGYKGKAYSCRYVMDSGYVDTGDRVKLLYHSEYDAFRQAHAVLTFNESNRKSRLIGWSSIRDFTPLHRLLLLCLLLSAASFFFISGLVVCILPIPFLQTIARFILVVALGCAAVFYTYDIITYFRYYQQLKTAGHAISVPVLSTNRTTHGRKYSWYEYEATIQHRGRERVIPISEDEFDKATPASSMMVRYNASVDDLMSVGYTPTYGLMVVPLFFGLLVFLLIRPVR